MWSSHKKERANSKRAGCFSHVGFKSYAHHEPTMLFGSLAAHNKSSQCARHVRNLHAHCSRVVWLMSQLDCSGQPEQTCLHLRIWYMRTCVRGVRSPTMLCSVSRSSDGTSSS